MAPITSRGSTQCGKYCNITELHFCAMAPITNRGSTQCGKYCNIPELHFCVMASITNRGISLIRDVPLFRRESPDTDHCLMAAIVKKRLEVSKRQRKNLT
jgi:hypothetical protein